MGEQSPRLTRGRPAVQNRFIRGLLPGREAFFFLAADQWAAAFLSL